MARAIPFSLSVNGRAEIPHHAERAIVNVAVASSGPNKAGVSDEVITTAKHVENLCRELSPQDSTPEAKQASPLAHWSKTSLTATSHIPYTANGDEKPRVFDARVNFDIRFKEFKALGGFGARLSALSHVEVNSIQWILTAATEKSYRSQLRKEAARDALQKAQDYCEVLGCSNLTPVELEEQTGFTRASAFGTRNATNNVAYQQMQAPRGFQMGSQAAGQRDESPLEFTPEVVKMTMEVTVKFHADSRNSASGSVTKRARADDTEMDEQ